MRTLLFIAALLVSSAASAQVTFRLSNNTDTLRFGKGDCAGRILTATWTRTTTNLCAGLTVWLTREGSCTGTGADSPADYGLTDISQTTFLASATGSLSFNVTNLPFDVGDGGSGCGVGAEETTFRLCGATRQLEGLYGTCGTTAVYATAAKLIYDGKPPPAPEFSDVAGLDSAARITLTSSGDAITERVEAWLDGELVVQKSQGVGVGPIQLEGLENNTTYELRAYASDEAGNTNETPTTAEVTPIKTNGFLELYNGGGGKETGGCGAVGGGVAGGAVLAVLGFWLSSRRRRSWLEQ
jgi:uncharacterized protein (TIGR03382 family)